jgi:hypothetical protein
MVHHAWPASHPSLAVVVCLPRSKALYTQWNANTTVIANKWTVTGYWLAPQNDSLIGSLTKDSTWGDITGYTDWAR